jgi:dTDP-4-dehydrorhamnose 3,5-epimerase
MLSEAGTLRGVHVHRKHADFLVLVKGAAWIGVRDLRPGSPTEGCVQLLRATEHAMTGIVIPPGVAHGFLFDQASVMIYGVTSYFDPADELGCHWADPALGIPWPFQPTLVSDRDSAAPPLSVVVDSLRASPPASPAG